MPTALLEQLYRGDRAGAQSLAREMALDVFEAAALGVLEQVIERCEEDAGRVGAYSDDGWTPLHFAAYFGNNACVKELLRRGAAVDARARNGSAATPLHSACAGNHTPVALTLIAAGADVNAAQRGGYHPLDNALQNGNAKIVRALRLAGARSRDDSGPGGSAGKARTSRGRA
jgi:ankyrin repeat protein